MAETLAPYLSELIETDANDQMVRIAKYVPDPNPFEFALIDLADRLGMK
jgi:hypothetical protein